MQARGGRARSLIRDTLKCSLPATSHRKARGMPQVPGVAPQQCRKGVRRKECQRLMRGEPTQQFRYRNRETWPSSDGHAHSRLGKVKFTGRFAWLFWLFLHIMYLSDSVTA